MSKPESVEPGLPGGDERFEPGGIDEAASQAYERTVADPPPAED